MSSPGTLTISQTDSLLKLLHQSFPAAFPASTTKSTKPDAPSILTLPTGGAPAEGSNTIASHIAPQIFKHTPYTPLESAEISQWLTLSSRLASSIDNPDLLQILNAHLSTRSTVLGYKPSIADIALYARVAPLAAKWTPEQRTGEHGYHHIVRFIDFVQNAPLFGLKLAETEKVKVDLDEVLFVLKPVDLKAEKERLKKEKAAAEAGKASPPPAGAESKGIPEHPKGKKDKAKEKVAEAVEGAKATAAAAVPGVGAKKEKKEKAPKLQKAPAAPASLSLTLIDLRVGHILQCTPHPNADSLYVSLIACGDPPGFPDTTEHAGEVVRTVCSGLNGLVPLEEMQGRWVVTVCNLKPVTMRGIKSAAMVLAASPRDAEGHGGPVELVTPPEGVKAGERVWFEGWEGKPEGVLNPKKKIWEQIQPGFTTTEGLEVAFDAGVVEALGEEGRAKGVRKLVTESGGACTVKSLKGATVR